MRWPNPDSEGYKSPDAITPSDWDDPRQGSTYVAIARI
jgi:hypothetical protein